MISLKEKPASLLHQTFNSSFSVLPVTGMKITGVEEVTNPQITVRTNKFWRINGEITPVDPHADKITFQIGMPVKWNKKLIQLGGGGLDGILYPVEHPVNYHGYDNDAPCPLKNGYAVCNCDGGHLAVDFNHPTDLNRLVQADWALNDETLKNFAYQAQKKVKDAADYLLQVCFGQAATEIYYYGGSNGGRECLKTLEHYGDEYDGAICYFPVLYWVLKVIADSHNGHLMDRLGEKANIDQEELHLIRQTVMKYCDRLDQADDGIVSNFKGAQRKTAIVQAELNTKLKPAQYEFLKARGTDTKLNFPLGFGETYLPGYAVYQGAPVNGLMQMSAPSLKDKAKSMWQAADAVIGQMILRQKYFDPQRLHIDDHKRAFQKASRLLDAYGVRLHKFFVNGGKILLLQGLEDNEVTPQGTINYFKEMRKEYGDKLDQHMKFYLIPGYGHSGSTNYNLDLDTVDILDKWINEDETPDILYSRDCNPDKPKRSRPLYPYPYYPEYDQKGNMNSSTSFRPAVTK